MTSVQLGTYSPPTDKNEYVDVTLGIFFDGTLNNKTNTEARVSPKPGDTSFKKYGAGDEQSSYYNDWSNVARLWDNYDKSKSIYIEGIGTENELSDSLKGYAFGSGVTGIRGKVRKGCEKIVSDILTPVLKKSKNVKLRTVTIDVFGFSRGSAAARNFVYEIGKPEYKSQVTVQPKTGEITKRDSDDYETGLYTMPAGGHLGLKLSEAGFALKPTQIRVRFLGIFDTVSSYAKNISLMPNFSNDVSELHLNEIGKAQHVIHFTAADEHRENFSLTPVHVGKEKSFPGVHCDIGGSYESGKEVKQELETTAGSKYNLDPFKKNLIDQCWYKENELEITGGFLYWALKGTRTIKKEYSYIPLQFMAEYGEKSDLPLRLANVKRKYTIDNDPLLTRVKGYLTDYVMGNGIPYTFKYFADIDKKYAGAKIPEQHYADKEKEKQAQADLRILRNKYLHWSARREGTGMDQTADGKRQIMY